jgi:type IV pilus assembly protein PilB
VAEEQKSGLDWLERRGVDDPVILQAMREVPRDKFYDEDGDGAHSSRLDGVTITPPEVIAKMLEALELEEGATVLQVGTGTGYAAAILSQMAAAVFTVERDDEIAKAAQERLADLGYKNVQVLYGPHLKQYAANAPYDAILVSAGMMRLPQRLVRLRRAAEDDFREETVGDLKVHPLLGDILVEMGVVDREEVEMAALEADVKGSRLGEVLLDGAYVQEADIYRALAKQNEMELLTAQDVLENVDLEKLSEYPGAFLSHNRLIPIHDRDGMLHAVTTDPGNDVAELAYAMGLHTIDLHLITPTDYDLAWSAIDRGEVRRDDEEGEEGAVEAPAFDAETIAFFERIVRKGVSSRASDIHFERWEDTVEVFFRVDGELRPRPEIDVSQELMSSITELVKVSGRLDRKERRRPQTGHFQRRVQDSVFDIQARTVPTTFGEAVSLRILPQDAEVLTIDELGFTSDVAANLKQDLERRSGIILVVGPASSGKSTTLYSGLQHVSHDRSRKIVAVEYPVTYALRGVHQYRIDRHAFGIPEAIDTAISGDADVLLIGEINSPEIARKAIEASRAGHLVLASVSGRIAVDGVLRLLELDVSPNAVASELVSVIAQRLVKRVCSECRERVELDEEILAEVFDGSAPDDLTAFAGIGCSRCEQHGTRGRIPVTEYLPVDASVKAAITATPTAEGLNAASVNAGTTAMLDTGVRFVKSGIIPQDELRWIPRWT